MRQSQCPLAAPMSPPPDGGSQSAESRMSAATVTTVTTSVAAMATCTAITPHGSPLRYWYSPTASWHSVSTTPATARRGDADPRHVERSRLAAVGQPPRADGHPGRGRDHRHRQQEVAHHEQRVQVE